MISEGGESTRERKKHTNDKGWRRREKGQSAKGSNSSKARARITARKVVRRAAWWNSSEGSYNAPVSQHPGHPSQPHKFWLQPQAAL